jgi:tetratricopeptide (TPR) repeat protein
MKHKPLTRAHKLSVCVIGKNEAKHVGRMLDSIKGHADEVVFVDTGSTDKTIEIVKRYGVKLVEWAWRDDFAAARNVSIENASHDWVQIIDCDHVQTKGSSQAIHEGMAKPLNALNMWIHDANSITAKVDDVIQGRARQGDAYSWTGVIRKSAAPGPWFHRCIHEDMSRWLVDVGPVGVLMRAHYAHFGAIKTERDKTGKNDRNQRLLRKAIEQDPNDFVPHTYLAHEYIGSGDHGEAIEIVNKAWEHVKDVQLRGVHRLRLTVARAWLSHAMKKPEFTLNSCRELEQLDGEHPDIDFFRGLAWEMLGDIQKSIFFLRRASERYEPNPKQWLQRYVLKSAIDAALLRVESMCDTTQLVHVCPRYSGGETATPRFISPLAMGA